MAYSPWLVDVMKKKVVIVEDDQDIRELVEFILTNADFEVTGYDRVAKFWVGLGSAKPDLIVLDIMLPDGNGLDICRELQSAGQTADIPVVIMSAAYEGIRPECAKAAFIKKPFDVYDFVSRIQACIA